MNRYEVGKAIRTLEKNVRAANDVLQRVQMANPHKNPVLARRKLQRIENLFEHTYHLEGVANELLPHANSAQAFWISDWLDALLSIQELLNELREEESQIPQKENDQ